MLIRRGGARGTGAVLSSTFAVTCEHVTRGASSVDVRNPQSGSWEAFDVVDADVPLDIALLRAQGAVRLAEDSVVVPRALWSGGAPASEDTAVELCTDDPQTPRSLRVDLARAPASARRVQFRVIGDREGVVGGHSGGPVVEHVAGFATPRMLGIVRARDRTSLDAYDHAGVGWMVPTEPIAERFDDIAALVETPFERDAAWLEHWEPRSRGVATRSDPGFFFSGRERAFARLREHLLAGSGLLVVTGERGRGKSALLARAVTLAARRYLSLHDRATIVGSSGDCPPIIDAAVLARGHSPAWVGTQIARQLGCGQSDASGLVRCVSERSSRDRAPSIVIDAVDECDDPGGLMREVAIKLADAGARVAIAALRARIALDTRDASWIDLDAGEYGDDPVPEYVERRLCSGGRYSAQVARTVARVVGARAHKNLLYAELVARRLAAGEPICTTDPNWKDQVPADLTDAFSDYLGRFGDRRDRVLALLHPLAHSRGDGFTVDPPTVWLATANALRPDALAPFEQADLRAAADKARDYLIAEGHGGARRLYHLGLADAIVRLCATERLLATGQDPTDDAITRAASLASRRCTSALSDLLPRDPKAPAQEYASLDPYLRMHIASHLSDIGRTNELLDRPGLLLVSEPESVRTALARRARDLPAEREPARIAIVHALARPHATQESRAVALCSALRCQGDWQNADAIRTAFYGDQSRRLPSELISGEPLEPDHSKISRAHGLGVTALTVVKHEGRALIISGSADGALRSWRLDGTPGPLARNAAHSAHVKALAVLNHHDPPLVISADDGSMRSWRLDGGQGPVDVRDYLYGESVALTVVERDDCPLIIIAGLAGELRSYRVDGTFSRLTNNYAYTRGITALAIVAHENQPLVVSAGRGGALRSWHLDGKTGPFSVRGHGYRERVAALAAVEHDDQLLVITASSSGALRSWHLDGAPGPVIRDDAHSGCVTALVVLEYDDQPLIISAGDDGALRSWRLDGTPGPLARDDAHSDRVTALVLVEHDDQPLIISAGDDGALRSWRLDGAPGPLARQDAHSRWVEALAVIEHDEQPLIISGGRDGTLRSVRLQGTHGPLTRDHAHALGVTALTVAHHDDQPVIISGGGDGALRSVHLDGAPGPLTRDHAHALGVTALAVVDHDDQPLIISGGYNAPLRSWRLDGTRGPLNRHAHWGGVTAVAVVDHDDFPLVISGGYDGTLRSWRLDGAPGPLKHDTAHSTGVTALVVVEYLGRPLIVSAGGGEALRSWHLDGSRGPLARDATYRHLIGALAVVEHAGQPLIVSAGEAGALRSWRVDGSEGPLVRENAHSGWVGALAIVEHDNQSLIISAGDDRSIVAHMLDSASG